MEDFKISEDFFGFGDLESYFGGINSLFNIINGREKSVNLERQAKRDDELENGKLLSNGLRFKSVVLDEKYAKKWNVHSTDFGYLYADGVKVSNTLYRIGGMGHGSNDRYVHIIKHVEAIYEKNITTDPKRKRHLESHFCIVDSNGVEKVVFDSSFDSGYLGNGITYTKASKHYNIETGELYCDACESMSTSKFLFLNNAYDKDKTKRGVMKINIVDGTYELFPE